MAAHKLRQSARQAGLPMAEGTQVPSVLIRSARIDCYNDGDIVVEQPISDGVDRIKYIFDVALTEPGLVDCQPLVPLANDLTDFAERVVGSFDKDFV